MTDIRVVRPACEGIFEGEKIYGALPTSTMVMRYFLDHPDEVIPITKYGMEQLVVNLVQWDPWGQFLGKDLRKLRKAIKCDLESGREVTREMARVLGKDLSNNSLLTTLLPIKRYMLTPEKERKVYVFEGRFFDQFSKVNIKNLRTEHLPHEGCGCLVLPKPIVVGGNSVDELIFSADNECLYEKSHEAARQEFLHRIKDIEDISILNGKEEEVFPKHPERKYRTLTVVGISREAKRAVFADSLDLVPGKKVEEIPTKDASTQQPISEVDTEAKFAIRTTLNLLAYLKSGRPDIREFCNTIRYRGRSTVHVHKEDEELSRSKIFLVGYNWLKNPVYTIDGWYSAGFMAWRMCGPGRTEPRLVYFSPSFKQRRKGREDVVKEEDATEEDFTYC